VTGDALYAQRAVCQHVLEAGGDYLVIVKRNQPMLCRESAWLCAAPPPGRARGVPSHGAGTGIGRVEVEPGEAEQTATAEMRAKLRTEAGRAAYAQHKQTVEPVFGQRKERRGLRRSLLRGLVRVQGEWALWCLTHNLGRIVQALWTVTGLRERLVMATVEEVGGQRGVDNREPNEQSCCSNTFISSAPVQSRHTPSHEDS
jgi:hypothetical protein